MKPDRISGQIAALVVVSLVAIHALITTVFLLGRPDAGVHMRGNPQDVVSVVKLIGAARADERPEIMAALSRAFPAFDIGPADPKDVMGGAGEDGYSRFLREHLGPGFKVWTLPHDNGRDRIAVLLPDGAVISSIVPTDSRGPRFFGGPWITALLFGVVCVSLLGLWAARALTAPLSALAQAAQDFSLTSASAPLSERGPEEVRSVAKAFNRMRERITDLINGRTRMLAAISHDLRTPITRMRLRCEFITDPAQRSQMLHDLDQMRTMLDSVLSFLRDGRNERAAILVDAAVAVQTICDQFADMNHKVRYDGPLHVMITAQPDDLHRAVTNLVENAVKFGSEVGVRLTVFANRLEIEIEDDGPGISDFRKKTVLEPFVRGDEARTMNDASGFGLGLAITRAIVDAHGGTLSLHDRHPNGLVVRIDLPIEVSENAPLFAGLEGAGAQSRSLVAQRD